MICEHGKSASEFAKICAAQPDTGSDSTFIFLVSNPNLSKKMQQFRFLSLGLLLIAGLCAVSAQTTGGDEDWRKCEDGSDLFVSILKMRYFNKYSFELNRWLLFVLIIAGSPRMSRHRSWYARLLPFSLQLPSVL